MIKGHSNSERIDSWYKHFSELLGKGPDIPVDVLNEDITTIFTEEELNIKTGEFTMDEYQQVKIKITTGKAAGDDGITAEVLKYCNLDEIVLNYANKLLLDGEKPKQWSKINVIPLPKSGDLSKTTNYRSGQTCQSTNFEPCTTKA